MGVTPLVAVESLKEFKPAAYTLHGRLTRAKVRNNLLLIDKPATQQSLTALRKTIDASEKQPVFYIDLSGIIPEGFKMSFFQEFSGYPAKVFLFLSALHAHSSDERISDDPGRKTIISLNEYYLEETSDTRLSNQKMVNSWKHDEQNDPLKIKVEFLENFAELVQQLQTKDTSKVHVMFTWNFQEVYQTLKTDIEFG
jgi:hypothetical protein